MWLVFLLVCFLYMYYFPNLDNLLFYTVLVMQQFGIYWLFINMYSVHSTGHDLLTYRIHCWKLYSNRVPAFKRNTCWHRLWPWDTTLSCLYQWTGWDREGFVEPSCKCNQPHPFLFCFDLFSRFLWIEINFLCLNNYLDNMDNYVF